MILWTEAFLPHTPRREASARVSWAPAWTAPRAACPTASRPNTTV